MATTLKQIAEILDLDYSTVSYALSGKGSINETTRQRVRDAAERLGYIPNGLARRMRATKSHNIGVVLPDTILKYNEIIQQLYRVAIDRGYESQIALTEFDEQAEDRAIRSFLEARMDGIIVRSRYGEWENLPQGAALRQAATQKIPIVIYGKDMTGSPFPSLVLSIGARSVKLVDYLIALGHRHMAILLPVATEYHHPHDSMIEGARESYLRAFGCDDNLVVHNLDEHEPGQAPPEGLDEYGNYLDEMLPRRALARGRRLLQIAMRSDPQPTAVVAYNEITAIGAYLEAQDNGIDVPGDLSIASVSRGLAAELSPIPLTTCDVLPREVATAALDLLIETMGRPSREIASSTVEPLLIVGATTGAPSSRRLAASARNS